MNFIKLIHGYFTFHNKKNTTKIIIMKSFAVKINKPEQQENTYFREVIVDTDQQNSGGYIQLNRKDYFKLYKRYENKVRSIEPKWGFNQFSEFIFYRTYSRRVNNAQETFHDTIIRVINGVFTIRKNYYVTHEINWDEESMQKKAFKMAKLMLEFKLLPPGRGLWACGTDQMYNRGSAALFNCGAISTKNLVTSVTWCMDSLMHGIGVGFDTSFDNSNNEIIIEPSGLPILFVIADTRESWVKSVEVLLKSYSTGIPVEFDYSKIRPEGKPIGTFGGISCGFKPLMELHQRIRKFCTRFIDSDKSKGECTRLVADIFNALGYCVVSGNVRRSAEIILGDINDDEFLGLKNLEKNPERSDICWMSNNTVVLRNKKDLNNIDRIMDTLKNSGEPGILYLPNIKNYGRMYTVQHDSATLCNPCGEIPLESGELCNLCEVFPSNCETFDEFLEACKMATFYCSTVNLLPTHNKLTNEIINKNHRIGVSLSGIADFIDNNGLEEAEMWFSEGYKCVKTTNHRLALECGIEDSIRLTTIKPSGTVSILAGVSPGLHYGIFKHCIRRVRVSKLNVTLVEILKNANVPYEDDLFTADTYVFEFPLKFNNTRSQKDIPLWEQFSNLAFMQRVWSDNMCSITATFGKEEIDQIPTILKYFIPQIKGCSMLPKVTEDTIYKQVPYEEITEEEYNRRVNELKEFDWNQLCSDGIDTRFCTNASCEV